MSDLNSTAAAHQAAGRRFVASGLDLTRLQRGGLAGAMGALYVVAGTAGIDLEVAEGVITPVWAPTGIALFTIVLLGYGVWPAIAAAAFVTNVTNDAPAHLSAGIAIGNTLEALGGAWFLRSVVGFDPALRRTRDVLGLATGAALVSTAISATVGTTTLWAGGELAESYGSSWLLWWFGDVMGALLVAPLLFAWVTPDHRRLSRRRAVEGIVLATLLVGGSVIVFFGGNWEFPSVLFPLLLWAALRFGQRGVTAATLIVVLLAIAATIDGSVAIEETSARQTVQIIQALVAVVGVPLLVLTAAIEERTVAEQAVRESLELHQAILQSTADGLLVVDDTGHIVSFNQQFADLWGLPEDVLASRDDERAVAWVLDQLVDPEAFQTRIRDLYGSDEVEDVGELRFKDGRLFERNSRPYQLDDRRGRVWSFRDITAQREAQEVKQRFLSMATHELRAPLSVTAGMSAALLEDWMAIDDVDKQELLGRIHDSARRLTQLVEDLLATSAIESGRLEPRVEEIVVVDAVRRAIAEADVPGVRLDVPDVIVALADPGHLRQVLVNLLTNAAKYGRPPVTVEGRLDSTCHVELSVIDWGDGVPADVLPRLFERFVRASAALRAGVPGTGLGLSIARDLARAQGGDVVHDPTYAPGARFTVRLPAAGSLRP